MSDPIADFTFGRMGCCGKPEGCTMTHDGCTFRNHPAKHGKRVRWGQTSHSCGVTVWQRIAFDGAVSFFEPDMKTGHLCGRLNGGTG